MSPHLIGLYSLIPLLIKALRSNAQSRLTGHPQLWLMSLSIRLLRAVVCDLVSSKSMASSRHSEEKMMLSFRCRIRTFLFGSNFLRQLAQRPAKIRRDKEKFCFLPSITSEALQLQSLDQTDSPVDRPLKRPLSAYQWQPAG